MASAPQRHIRAARAGGGSYLRPRPAAQRTTAQPAPEQSAAQPPPVVVDDVQAAPAVQVPVGSASTGTGEAAGGLVADVFPDIPAPADPPPPPRRQVSVGVLTSPRVHRPVVKPSNRLILTDRDHTVMWLLARYRAATLTHVAHVMATSTDAARRRLNRIEDAGFITSRHLGVGSPRIYGITEHGCSHIGTDLAPSTFAIGQLGHALAVTDIGIRLEERGEHVLTEREVRALDTHSQPGASATTNPLYAILTVDPGARTPSTKLPDLVIDRGGIGADIAVEVELTAKTSIAEHERLMRAYTASTRYGAVTYFTHQRLARMLTQAATRAHHNTSGARITIRQWTPSHTLPVLSTLPPARRPHPPQPRTHQ